ncbi:Activating signal cointegrator 1 complex subunit 3 [Blattella germanica]|nr:Activating signal cointegrator 1 complex subunit 3 [Blattella germanica]
MPYQFPRLTNSFRAFSGLSRPDELQLPEDSLESYQKWRAKQTKQGLTFSDISKIVEEEIGKNNPDLKLLSHVSDVARSIAGDDQGEDVVDGASVFLFRLFLGEYLVLQRHLLLLKQMFGAVSLKLANEACQAVIKISSHLSEECIERLKGEPTLENGVKKSHFGEDIKFNFQEVHTPCPNAKFLVDLSALTGSEILKDFSMNYDNVAALMTTKEDTKKNQSNSRKNGYGKSWLDQEVQKFYQSSNQSGLSPEEITETIVSMLKSGRSNDELQNELFDLLGFDRFELIQSLLEHRSDIIYCASVDEEKKLISSQPGAEQRRPNYGCQVVVQSEQEKLLFKQARKEEKKINKVLPRNEEDEDELDFNVLELRAKRQAALKVAMNAPIFQKARASQPQEKYPHVYDSQRQIQQTSGFIAGVKIMLSPDVKRVDNKLYEEVNIPVSETAPLSVGNKLVSISSLDEIGQMAFQGVKSLNRIQSVVFDAAYHTNENLLICAPTGAGKTNVALLTIVHQIRQFIEHGVIKRDQFKIVYVAPMKALAAEMTQNFNKKLNCLGILVKELTGDMQLTKTEIMQTQMLVTTPEKWDVVTRKGTGDVALTNLVKLLIIDEVHLLHGDRGPVVEALVARTLRLVESSQSMIRIVGLSATLPNYLDVAKFLRVNPYKGLFYFDSRFRPVPLSTTFVGVKAIKPLQQMNDMDQICFDKVLEMVQKGHQVMVFVHARNATVRTAMVLKEMALQKGQAKVFEPEESGAVGQARKSLSNSRNKQLGELFPYGFSVHHAGMLRSDRSMVEKYFGDGLIKVLVCTSTLAWGVNLPAHAVIIRGTEIYDAKHGSFVDLGILDVLQIFGRAGRPQFDKSGHGVIITSHDKLSHYLSLLTNQFPIESNFVACLADNLNAEISLGTISNVDEAVQWLSYTYLFVRMKINPQNYGFNYQDVQDDPTLDRKRRELINCAADCLDKAKMIRYNARTGDLSITDLGRTASHFYIKCATIEVFNEHMQEIMTEPDILCMISFSQEFEQLKVRDDELDELDNLTNIYCHVPVKGGSENLHGKINILFQTFLSHGRVNSFSLMSDQAYITQNAVRIARALFDIVLRKNNPIMAGRFLMLSKMFEQQQWDFETPMRQFRILGQEIIQKIEDRKLNVDKLRDMDVKEIGIILRHAKMGVIVKRCAQEFPLLDMEPIIQPITRTVLRIRLQVKANFRWNDKVHGKTSEAFYIWIEDPENNFMYHSEFFLITKKQVLSGEPQELVMTIPITEPLPSQYCVTATSDRWLGSVTQVPITFHHLILPESHPPHTNLLELQPLPVTALNDAQLEMLYPFSHFNPIQTQIFHCLYHTDNNVLLGAPTGSGKTIAAEIAMFRVFKVYPGCKVVYIAPLKALVRERIEDWKVRLEVKLNRKVVELTGDVSPDIRAISEADVIVTTPEKWDGISRSWQTRNYVQDVALIVIDEIHLLGEDRGPVLEVIVSRTNFIASHTSRTLRIVGLSTALANAKDLANWLGIGEMGLYNFRPSVRPVPLEVHIAGFPGKHYCPRMATMNRPTFQAIRQHSPAKPTLVFVSSRRQTRLTALDLIAYLAAEDDPKQWLHMSEQEMEQVVAGVKDTNLKLTLAFGIGMHHAGLQERDRKTVEELFVNQKIQGALSCQNTAEHLLLESCIARDRLKALTEVYMEISGETVLIATATLAWGVNFPAHLVVVKGTEYYDGKTRRYVDMPITDVLQMMGRAGRPQFDDHGVAVVLVHDVKKNFYKKFLYEPFPVESSLLEVLPDHLNAEIVAGTVQTKQDALDYLTWTYFFRRLLQNPTYYELDTLEPEDINRFLSGLVQRALNTLGDAYCMTLDEDGRGIHPTSMGRIASFYYLSHQTMQHFQDTLGPDLNMEQLLKALSDAYEYDQLPVHYEIIEAPSPTPSDASTSSSELSSFKAPPPKRAPAKDPPFRLDGKRREHILAKFPPLKSKSGPSRGCRIHRVLCDMPALNIDLSVRGWWANENSEVEKHFRQPPTSNSWIQIQADQEYTLMVRMERRNRPRELKAHCPRFPRGKDEGWFLTLGSLETGELMALKRVPGTRSSKNCQLLTFYTPKRTGRTILTLYIMSDCYLGLDQQYNLHLDVVPANLSSQVNTELKDLDFGSSSDTSPEKGLEKW